MAEGRHERRLAAILAADVAGYSRLMGSDEEGTLAALKAIRRDVIDPKIAAHRGRIVKTTGDGAPHRIFERGGCPALCGRSAASDGQAKCRRTWGWAHRVSRRYQPL